MGRGPDLCAGDTEHAAHDRELLSKDTNPDLLETNNSSQEHDSGDDTMNHKHEQSIVDLTEIDASDGMLFDGLRRILEERQERKQERSALKEKRNKRRRPEEGNPNDTLTKKEQLHTADLALDISQRLLMLCAKAIIGWRLLGMVVLDTCLS
ncbi:hypothetical protein VPH35_135874 [Triticum aestivum]